MVSKNPTFSISARRVVLPETVTYIYVLQVHSIQWNAGMGNTDALIIIIMTGSYNIVAFLREDFNRGAYNTSNHLVRTLLINRSI